MTETPQGGPGQKPVLFSIGAVAADAQKAPAPDKKDLDAARDELALKSDKLAYDQRKKYGAWLWWLTVAWLSFVAAILLLEGFVPDRYFHLADTIVVSVVGGATAGALGYFAIVLRNIFPER